MVSLMPVVAVALGVAMLALNMAMVVFPGFPKRASVSIPATFLATVMDVAALLGFLAVAEFLLVCGLVCLATLGFEGASDFALAWLLLPEGGPRCGAAVRLLAVVAVIALKFVPLLALVKLDFLLIESYMGSYADVFAGTLVDGVLSTLSAWGDAAFQPVVAWLDMMRAL